MAVSCNRGITGLWVNEERSDAWAYLSGADWRKLDNDNDDAYTNLLVLDAQGAEVKVRKVLRGDRWYIN